MSTENLIPNLDFISLRFIQNELLQLATIECDIEVKGEHECDIEVKGEHDIQDQQCIYLKLKTLNQ
jgi:hypothetical protein